MAMGSHRPLPSSRRHAERIASVIGADIDVSRSALASSIEEVARRAQVAPSTVVRVLHGDAGVHLDTLCAVGAAVGLRISVKAFPSWQPSLRDSGQLRVAEYLVAQAHGSLKPTLELPVGDPYGRAADIVFFGPTEIIHAEIERRVPDLQAPVRAANVKRAALQDQHARRVRLVLAVEDTHHNRSLIAPTQRSSAPRCQHLRGRSCGRSGVGRRSVAMASCGSVHGVRVHTAPPTVPIDR